MFATLVDRDSYNVTDSNIYLSGLAPIAAPRPETGSELPPLPQYDDVGSLPGSLQPTLTTDKTIRDADTPTGILPPAPDRKP
jgi:hypothetical protein